MNWKKEKRSARIQGEQKKSFNIYPEGISEGENRAAEIILRNNKGVS